MLSLVWYCFMSIQHKFKFNAFNLSYIFMISVELKPTSHTWVSVLNNSFSLAPFQPHDCSGLQAEICCSWAIQHIKTVSCDWQLRCLHLSTLIPYGTNYLQPKKGKNKGEYQVKPHFFFLWSCSPPRATVFSHLKFLVHVWHAIVSRLLWTSDQLLAETSSWQHTTLTAEKHSYPRWDSNPWSQQASSRTPTP